MSLLHPATFLDLVQRTRMECAVSGPNPSPTTVIGQIGILENIVAWVATAWDDIQAKHQDWHFLRKSTTWATVSGQGLYTTSECGIAADRFGLWDLETFRNFTTTIGTQDEIHMAWMDYDDWRDGYFYGATRDVTTRPTVFAVAPDHGIALGPIPNGLYTVGADYYEAPVNLVVDADAPSVPKQHIMVIVYKAMMSYGEHEAAPEAYSRGGRLYAEKINQLERDRLNRVHFSGALA